MKHAALLVVIAAAPACSKTDADYRADVIAAIHSSVGDELDELMQAARALQAAAPARTWSATDDAEAIGRMRDAWKRTRIAYEHVEGATSPLFRSLEFAMDARYDDYLVDIGGAGDHALFDAAGVIGMHGIERILYAPDTRRQVVDFESMLDGYEPAAYPATDDQALAFKTVLVQKLIDDAGSLRAQWQPPAIDIGLAYQGLVGLMNEQMGKLDTAATGEEESRYANLTLFDLRTNLAGTRTAYALFQPWIQAHTGGRDIDAKITAKFSELAKLYGDLAGDALPVVPDDWAADEPTPANLATPFGKLWQTVHNDVDPTASGSVVFEMNQVATMLGFPEFVEE